MREALWRSALIPLIIGIGLLSGCTGAGDENRVELYDVTGQIMMNGAPVPEAAVTFSPKGDQPVAVGRTDNEGRYILSTYGGGDGAAAGEYVVLVTKTIAATSDQEIDVDDPRYGEAPEHGDQSQDRGLAVLPARYSRLEESDLKATVTPGGDNVFNFELRQ